MTSSLSILWQALPDGAVNYLGRRASHSVWERHLAIHPVVDLQPNWQVLDEGASQDSSEWGLQSITLNTALAGEDDAWNGRWPDELPGANADEKLATQLFGTPLIHDRTIAIYQILGPEGLGWVAQCMFTERGKLLSLTLVRMHDWLPLGDHEQAVTLENATPKEEPTVRASAGTRAKRAGWYEATLPSAHPMQTYFANSEARLVYRNRDEVFPTLGVTPRADEALVEWVWIRGE